MADFSWVALGQIIWIDLILSADNALVIAMAVRGLPEQQRRRASVLGAAVAVALRIVLTLAAAALMRVPGLQMVSAAALLFIAVSLVMPPAHDERSLKAADQLWRAVRLIAIADAVMSLDNAIAVAAIARGNVALLMIGLVLSIPLIVAGSALVSKLIDRFPIALWCGAAMLGWVAGELFLTDKALRAPFGDPHSSFGYTVCGISAALAVVFGILMRLRAMLRARRGAK